MSDVVVVVVVTYNSADVLARPGRLTAAGVGDLPWHLVVADNASTDDSLDVVRRLAPDATSVDSGATRVRRRHQRGRGRRAAPHTPCSCSTPTSGWTRAASPSSSAPCGRTGAGIAVPAAARRARRAHPSMRREPTVLRALGDAVLGREPGRPVAELGEVVTDPRGLRHRAVTRLGRGLHPAGRRRVLARLRALGRVATSSTPRRRTSTSAPATRGFVTRYVPPRRRGAPRGRLRDIDAAVAAAGRQPAAALPPRHGAAAQRALLGRAARCARAAGRCWAATRAARGAERSAPTVAAALAPAEGPSGSPRSAPALGQRRQGRARRGAGAAWRLEDLRPDVGRGVAGSYSEPRLDPGAVPRPAAVAGVHRGVAQPAQSARSSRS